MFILASFWLSQSARPRPRRWFPFLVSLLLHLGVTAAIVAFDARFQSAENEERQYRLTMLPKAQSSKDRVLWYDFRRALPEVAPQQPFGPANRPQGEVKLEPTIVAQSPKADSKRQMIWQPDRPTPMPQDIPAPNLVALPAPPAPVPKPQAKVFVPPPVEPEHPRGTPVIQAPMVDDSSSPDIRNEAPNLSLLENRPRVSKPPPRPFVMPSSAPAQNGGGDGSIVVDAPVVNTPGTGSVGDLRAVIVGLNPAEKLSGPPEGSRGGQFSQAPDLGVPSSGNASQPGAPKVPGLIARGTQGGGASPVAGASPAAPAVPDRRILREIKLPPINRTLSVPLRPAARVIPATVESVFANRNVYTMLIPAPEVPNYQGDWVLWFAGRQTPAGQSARVAAPVPARKFTLDGDASNAGSANGIVQMAAVIDRGGRVSAVRILRSPANEELRRKAVEELQSWEFQPALQNSEPMDVDIVIEISFKFGMNRQIPPAR